MDASELDRIEALCAAATPGEWRVEDPLGPDILSIVAGGPSPYEWQHVAQLSGQPDDADDISEREALANAAMIASARTNLPALVAECRRLRMALEQANEALMDAIRSEKLGVVTQGTCAKAQAAARAALGHAEEAGDA